MSQGRVIAVFNSSQDITDVLRFFFEAHGFVVVTAYTHELRDGKIDLTHLMEQFAPGVIVYDVALPYEVNWRWFETVRDSPACRGVRFVVTTTNVAQVRKVAPADIPLIEIVGKPYDLQILLDAVERAFNAGPENSAGDRQPPHA